MIDHVSDIEAMQRWAQQLHLPGAACSSLLLAAAALQTIHELFYTVWKICLQTSQVSYLQVVHHLFPGVCHTHYPAIAPIVLDTCKEFNVPYKVYPSVSFQFLPFASCIA